MFCIWILYREEGLSLLAAAIQTIHKAKTAAQMFSNNLHTILQESESRIPPKDSLPDHASKSPCPKSFRLHRTGDRTTRESRRIECHRWRCCEATNLSQTFRFESRYIHFTADFG